MATETSSQPDTNADTPSQTVVTSSIVVPSTSTAKRSSRNDALPKRRASSDFSRHNTEEAKRPRLNITSNEAKKRGQRLFGVLLGTLTKFKTESQNKSEAEIKREQIDQKLQEKLKKDHDELKECWKNQKRNLANFLCTTSEPPLYYLPARLSQPMLETIAVQKRHLALTLSPSIQPDIPDVILTNEKENNAEVTDIIMIEQSNVLDQNKELIEENPNDTKGESAQSELKVLNPSEKAKEKDQEDINIAETMKNNVEVPSNNEDDCTDTNDAIHENTPTKDVVDTVDSKDDPVEY
ncbi:11772_t:CDS:2 [Funneliformis geosporum]|uniref:722_t:CDS:1 n=1 Tax=Funneliformis geosporum TaxID=1117311 RepID=A0A9W4SCP3_9GLOM|nr:11772_t:CDS:2 [Funneliformis geosporum]CAI2164247.1 722_t:CDS:2 [Funneliformis geosporum]